MPPKRNPNNHSNGIPSLDALDFAVGGEPPLPLPFGSARQLPLWRSRPCGHGGLHSPSTRSSPWAQGFVVVVVELVVDDVVGTVVVAPVVDVVVPSG